MDQVKPRVFIASSVEGLPVAEAINSNLDHSAFPTLWKDGTFHLGSHSLDDLVKKSSQVDFAVFVFTPDDVVSIREKQAATVRDNVLFELGLFIGAIGKDRCYIVRPRGADMHLPSDLLGITVADYATDRGDNDWFSALNAACAKIKAEILRLGPFRLHGNDTKGKAHPAANPIVHQPSHFDINVLGVVAQSHVASPSGFTFHYIHSQLGRIPESMLALGLTKLLRMGSIERHVDEYGNGESYYNYSITEEGLDLFLANESNFLPPPPPRPAPKTAPKPAPSFEDDPPF